MKKSSLAFTLAELLIVVVIICCLGFFLSGFLNTNVNPPPPAPRFAPRYKVIDLKMLGWRAAALNENGEVAATVLPEAATEKDGNTLSHVGFWSGGKIRGLRPLIAEQTSVSGVNDSGEVVATQQLSSSIIHHAVLYRKGNIIELGKLGGRGSTARKINDKGQIVGTSDVGGRQQILDDEVNQHAFLWQDGVMTDLGTLSGKYSGANDINEAGQIVGESDGIPVLWSAGRLKKLDAQQGTARAISNTGQIVGMLWEKSRSRPFLWKAGHLETLNIPIGYTSKQIGSIEPADINDKNQIVGNVAIYGPADFHHRLKRSQASGFLWQKGKMENLNSIVPVASGWTIDAALAINNRGQILAAGHRKDGYTKDHVLLLTPIPSENRK